MTEITILNAVLVEEEKVSQLIIREVIKAQDVTIEVISGATITQKAYLKSIENAINK